MVTSQNNICQGSGASPTPTAPAQSTTTTKSPSPDSLYKASAHSPSSYHRPLTCTNSRHSPYERTSRTSMNGSRAESPWSSTESYASVLQSRIRPGYQGLVDEYPPGSPMMVPTPMTSEDWSQSNMRVSNSMTMASSRYASESLSELNVKPHSSHSPIPSSNHHNPTTPPPFHLHGSPIHLQAAPSDSRSTHIESSYDRHRHRSTQPPHSRIPRKPLSVIPAAPPPPFDVVTATVHTTTKAAGKIVMACPNNLSIPVLRRLNSVLFPIPYNDRFYTTVLENWDLCRLAFYNEECIGAISCRREPLTLQPSDKRVKVYIMTLGVLAPYRRLQIGTLLVESVISRCQADPYIDHFILHVQTTNREAIRFYKARGFRVEERVDGYYNLNKGVDPPDAYLLRRNLVGKKAERVQTPPPSQSEAVPSAVGLPRCSSPTPPNSSPAMGESLVETKNLSSCPKEKSSPNLPQEQLWRTNDIQTTSPSTSSSPARVDVTTFMPLRTPSIPGQSPWMNVSGPLGKAFAKQATRGM